MSAATTVADSIGGLAALHQHVVGSGWVVGLVFCHKRMTPLPPANALRALSPNAGVQIKTHRF